MESGTQRDGRRRGRLSRIWDKVTGALRRRGDHSGGAPAVVAIASQPTTGEAARSMPSETTPNAPAHAPTSTSAVQGPLRPIGGTASSTSPSASPAPAASKDIIIPTDDTTTMDRPESAEALLPMRANRSTHSHAKAQALFEKYGMKYEPSSHSAATTSSTSNTNTSPRRVEKPVRIRIHWTCHECRLQFGANKMCAACGHRRCEACPRAPAKKVRETLENARRELEEEQGGIPPPGTAGLGAAGVVVDAPGERREVGVVEAAAKVEKLEAQSAEAMAEEDPLPTESYAFLLQQRPIELGDESNAQPTRRSCHVCQTQFEPANRTACQGCGHTICTSCPREPIRTARDNAVEGSKMVGMVQRVYRKPRQRIRWSCHECNAMFVDKNKCRACGHERCTSCTRTPSKKAPAPFDPAVVQAVNEKLAQMNVTSPTA